MWFYHSRLRGPSWTHSLNRLNRWYRHRQLKRRESFKFEFYKKMYGNKQNKPYNLPSIRFEMKITHFFVCVCDMSCKSVRRLYPFRNRFIPVFRFPFIYWIFFILKELFIKRSKSKLGIWYRCIPSYRKFTFNANFKNFPL